MISRALHEKEGLVIPLFFLMLIFSFRSGNYEASWSLVLMFLVGAVFYGKYFFYKAKTNFIIFGSLIGVSLYSYIQCRNGHCWYGPPISISPFDFIYIICFFVVGVTVWKNYSEILTKNEIEIEMDGGCDYFGLGWVVAFVFGLCVAVLSVF